MKDETKRQLDQVFAAYERKLAERLQAKVAQETKEEKFIQAFRERCASTIKPAMERTGAYLLSKGLKTRIEETQERRDRDGKQEAREAITLLLLLGDDTTLHYRPAHQLPNLGLHPDRHREVVEIYQSTIGPGRGGISGGIGDIRLEDITPDFLEQKVLNLVKEVLK